MKKGYLVAGLLLISMILAGCALGTPDYRKNTAQRALTATSYGFFSHDRKILFDVYADTSIVYNGLNLSLAQPFITEAHQRLATQSPGYGEPIRLIADRLARDDSQKGTVFTMMVSLIFNDFDKKIYVNLAPITPSNYVNAKYLEKYKYPKSAALTADCKEMNVEQCTRALVAEAADISISDFEKHKVHFLNQ